MDCFINEDGRNETSKYFFSEACEVADQKTTLHSYHSKEDQHNPETNPTAPWQKFHMIYTAKLKYNSKETIRTSQLATIYCTTKTSSFIMSRAPETNWLVVRVILSSWFGHLIKVFLTEEAQFKKDLHEKTNCLKLPLKLTFQQVLTAVWISEQTTVGKKMVTDTFTHTS